MATPSKAGHGWTAAQVLAQAAVCLVLGLVSGFVLRGSQSQAAPKPAAQPAAASAQLTPEQLQQMAETQAAPLLAQLKADPNNPDVLARLGYIYYATHNFPQAADFYGRSIAAKDNPLVRIEFGRALYYQGDPDGALAQFQRVLKSEPGNANVLYNIGLIRLQDKHDAPGAIAAWQQLLKANPDHPRRAEVEKLIARARAGR